VWLAVTSQLAASKKILCLLSNQPNYCSLKLFTTDDCWTIGFVSFVLKVLKDISINLSSFWVPAICWELKKKAELLLLKIWQFQKRLNSQKIFPKPLVWVGGLRSFWAKRNFFLNKIIPLQKLSFELKELSFHRVLAKITFLFKDSHVESVKAVYNSPIKVQLTTIGSQMHAQGIEQLCQSIAPI